MYDVCQDSCLDSCVTAGSYDGTTQPPLTWGARQDLSHNLISLKVGGAVYLENTYGTDRFSPNYDRVVGQKFGPSKMSMSYTDVFAASPEVEVCPKSPVICESLSMIPERWVEGLDDLVFVVDLTVPMVPQWNIRATAGDLPAFTLKKVGVGLQMTPAASASPIILSSSTGETIEYLPTVVPGYFAPHPSSALPSASVPADLTAIRTDSGFALHAGRLRSVLEIVSGALSYPVLDFQRDQNGRLAVAPAAEAFGTVEVRELVRQSNGDGSDVARSSAVVRVSLQDGFASLADDEVVDAAGWAADNRAVLDAYDSPLAMGAPTVASVQTAVLQQRVGDLSKLADVDAAIAALLASSSFSADLTKQAETLPSARNDIVTATKPANDLATQLVGTASSTLRPLIANLPVVIDSAQSIQNKVQYTTQIDACITVIDQAMASATTTEQSKLSNIKSSLTTARGAPPVLNKFVQIQESMQANARVIASIQGIRDKNAALVASLRGWAPDVAIDAAASARLDFFEASPSEAHLWARAALQKLKTAWQGVKSKLPTGTPDLRRALRTGSLAALTAADAGVWVDRLFGIGNLIIRGPRCTGGQYLAEARTTGVAPKAVLLSTFQDGEKNSWKYYVDSRGLVVKSIAPTGDATHINYDNRGRVVAEMTPFGDRRCISYDGDGNVTHVAHFPAANKPAPQLSRRTTFLWNGPGLLSKAFAPNPETGAVSQQPALEIARDERGNPTSVTMGGASWELEYDQYGRTLSALAQDGSLTTYAYGADPLYIHITATTEGPAGVSGEVEQIADAAGNVVSIRRTGAPDRTITYDHHRPILIEDDTDDGIVTVQRLGRSRGAVEAKSVAFTLSTTNA